MGLEGAHRTALINAISRERLTSYLRATGGDENAALDLYLWNARLSAAVWEDLQILEVALRNACSRELERWHRALGHTTPWYLSEALNQPHKDDVATARDRVKRGKRAETTGRVIAELTFSFWRFLHSKSYEPTLWQHALRFAYGDGTGIARREVYNRLDHINTLRNRVAHHEPVHGDNIASTGRDLAGIHREMLDILRWLDPELASYVLQTSRLPEILSAKPTPSVPSPAA